MLTSLATSCSRARWSGWVVAAALAGPTRPATAAEPAPISEAAQSAYDRGLAERDAGQFPAAAREFAAAYSQIPVSQRELRAAVLFDLVDAHRGAYTAGGERRGNEHPAAHLCAADRALADFIETEQERKRGRKSPDMVKATGLREEVRKDFLTAKAREADLDCAALELPRVVEKEEPPPPPPEAPSKARAPNKLLIAGGVTAGVGLALVGLMIGGMVRGQRTEADGVALVQAMPELPTDDRQLAELERRGRGDNAMAVVGGVFGSLALGAGIALLVVGVRAKQASGRSSAPEPAAVAVWPLASPTGGGAALRWRF
ncbi:hypothetical protein [Nannocystis punicea]|uniref:Uncharacterized protein n=1 Tax=Nannocystis punicea TaxID=2995304 RepID=A0ABY7H134_9BACT|nr:hypothetical protein [Nannocystis poenicansa]WAS92966.1 hypothetical protein O0S08_42910 [Nannocystis poenicansa]